MAATYNEALTTDLDVVRSILGDTDVPTALHSNEHIMAVLALEGSVGAAVSFLASELVARFARQPVKWTADGDSYDYSSRIGAWLQLASRSASAVTGSGISQVPVTYGETTTDEYARPWGTRLW